MKNLHTIVQGLIPRNKELLNTSASEIIEHVCSNIYNQENYQIKDNEVFKKLPGVLRDIILLIDLDTELNMNGILGFIENSSGKYLEETIDVFERIEAINDANALKDIQNILVEYGTNTCKLNDDVQHLKQYEINNFVQTHRISDDEFYKRIQRAEESLYINIKEENIFEKLISYLEANKKILIEELNDYL